MNSTISSHRAALPPPPKGEEWLRVKVGQTIPEGMFTCEDFAGGVIVGKTILAGTTLRRKPAPILGECHFWYLSPRKEK